MSKLHSFIAHIRQTKEFDLTVYGISVSTAWFEELIVNSITIAISATSALLRITSTLAINTVEFVIDMVTLLDIPVTLVVNPIGFSGIAKLLERWTQTLEIKKIKLIGELSALLDNPNSEISINPIILSAIPIISKFYVLNYYSGSTLSQMDGSFLQDLDYYTP